LDFEGTTNLLECAEGDVLRLGLGIPSEQTDLANFASSKVDDPNATGLARSFSYPAHLADATRATNYGAGFWIQCNKGRELGALIFVPVRGHSFWKIGLSTTVSMSWLYT
jgi:hypothetical protein